MTPATISLIVTENQGVGEEEGRITLDLSVFLGGCSIDISSLPYSFVPGVELSDEPHKWSQFKKREKTMILESVL